MSKRNAVIADMDGTLADNTWRDPYCMEQVGGDAPIWPIINLAKMFPWALIVVSAREAKGDCFDHTWEWLNNHGLFPQVLLMRAEKDHRPDAEIKLELFKQHIEPYYNVQYVLDDRNAVVKMWRDLGLTCLQVAPGDFL